MPLGLFTVRAAQARTSRRSPQSAYDSVCLPRRPCVSTLRVALRPQAHLNDANRIGT